MNRGLSKMKRVVSLALCVILAFSVLSACGGANTGDATQAATQVAATAAATTATPATTAAAAAATSAATQAAATQAASQAAATTAAAATAAPEKDDGGMPPIEFSIFIDHTWFFCDYYDDPIAREVTKYTNVTLDVTRATEDTQLPIMIASGDLPDLVYTASNTAMTLLSDPEVCWSYNELVAKNNVDLCADAVEIDNNTRPDGNYYALLNAFTTQEAIDTGKSLISGGTRSVAYRRDIYEEIGSPPFKTLEDWENILVAAKEAHPDIIPLLYDYGYLRYFMNQMGINSSDVQFAEDGSVRHIISNPRFIEYYEILNRFYRKGLIAAEAHTYSYDKYLEVRNSGLAFMLLRSSGEAKGGNNQSISVGSDIRWKLLTYELSDDVLFINSGIGWSGLFITKKCKDPDRAIKYMGWMRSEEGRILTSWGIKGQDWDYNEKGQTVRTPAYQQGMKEGKGRQGDYGIGVWIFGDKGEENAFVDYAADDEDSIDNIDRLVSACKYVKVIPELYFCIPKEGEILTTYTKINEMIKTEEIKVIFAETESEMRANYESMVNIAKQIGVDELEKWMNDAINERKRLTQ